MQGDFTFLFTLQEMEKVLMDKVYSHKVTQRVCTSRKLGDSSEVVVYSFYNKSFWTLFFL